jgi:signal transduction histidine kinase
MMELQQKTDHLDEPWPGGVGFGDATVHELKTLLTAIIVSAELLADELKLDQRSVSARLVKNIIRNGHSLDEKLSNFPEMAGLLTGEFSFHPEPLDLEPVIRDIIAQLSPITRSKRQALTVALSSTLPTVRAHRQYLEQILLNLVANASKFTAEGGRITVSASTHDRNILVQVADNGIGVPADKQELIFEPYYQINGGKGSGLGLAITRLLVDLHGGDIWLESTPGQGSRFLFTLPWQAAA